MIDFNDHLRRCVQIFLVLGIEKLNLVKDRDTKLLDPIFYEDATALPNEDGRSLRNPFYSVSFEK